MIIEFTSDVPGVATKGDVVDMLEGAATAFVGASQARASDVTAMIGRSLEATLVKERADLKSALEEFKSAMRGTQVKPPGGDPGLESNAATVGTSASADRDARGRSDAKSRNVGDITRCIYLQRTGDDGAMRYATERLEKSYGLKRTSWTDQNANYQATDHESGIQRAGTESMTGAATYGYLVPPTYIQDVFRIMSEESVVTGTRAVPIGSGVEANYPALDQFGTGTGGKKSNYHAGVQLYRATENQQRTASDAVLNEITYKVTDLTGFTKVSRNLLADSWYPIDTFLQDLFAQAFLWRKDYDYLYGNGVGEPLGIFNSPALIGGGGVSGNAGRKTASSIFYDDLVWMLSKLHPRCWGGAYWVAHLSTLPFLVGIQVSAGVFAYQPNFSNTQADRPSVYGPASFQGVLLGMPLKFTEKVSAVGTAGDLSLICPSMYGECMKAGLEVGLSDQFLFDTDQIAIRWKMRNDAKPLWRSKFTDYQNTTSSPFVQLV